MCILLRNHWLASTFLTAALLLGGCGGKEAETDSADETASSEVVETDSAPAPSPPPAPAGNVTSAPLSTDDIARWEKGMDAELQAVREAGEKLKSGRTQEDTANAMMAVQEMSTADAGARAAGLEQERYQFVRLNLSSVVAYLAPPELDTTQMTQDMRDELRMGREKQLKRMGQVVPPEVIEALKPRAPELRKRTLELVGARFQAAGIR